MSQLHVHPDPREIGRDRAGDREARLEAHRVPPWPAEASAEVARTSILPVTAAEIRAVRNSFRLSIGPVNLGGERIDLRCLVLQELGDLVLLCRWWQEHNEILESFWLNTPLVRRIPFDMVRYMLANSLHRKK